MEPFNLPAGKGQAFVSDFVVATLIFMIILAFIVYIWDEIISGIDVLKNTGDMEWLSSTVMEQLVRSEGFPADWYIKPENVTVFGLVDSNLFGAKQDMVLDADKLMQLINLTLSDYALTRNRLLKTGKYDFYMEIECINSSDRGCFDGLNINKFSEGKVSCLNGFNLGVHNGYTDSYLWREAESYDDESGTIQVSDQDMSGDEGMAIPTSNEWLLYNLNISAPNEYWIWTRYNASDAIDINLSIDDITSAELYPASELTWRKSTSSFILSKGKHTLIINRTTPSGSPIRFDAIILTSDPDYLPDNTEAQHYGNFHLISPTVCIIGNYTEQADSTFIIPTTRTATFHSRIDSALKLRMVIWSGNATGVPVPMTSTTTTIPAGVLLCDIFASGTCPGGVEKNTCVFSLWQRRNSHAGICGKYTDADWDVCCKIGDGELTVYNTTGACSPGDGGVISLYQEANSHAGNYSRYPNNICLHASNRNITCVLADGICPTGYLGNLSSLYRPENSHAAEFDYYNYKICCNATG